MNKFICVALAVFLIDGVSIYAQDQSSLFLDRLNRIGHQLLDDPVLQHPEYRNCVTHHTDACGPWNDDYIVSQVHGPSVSETLDWIGYQLISRKLAFRFLHDSCKVAIDAMEGSPANLLWREDHGGLQVVMRRSIFLPPRLKEFNTERFSGNGYFTYLSKSFRENGSSDTPRQITYYNDAAVIDLAQLREIKNYVGTNDKGAYYLVGPPSSVIKINFIHLQDTKVNSVGASLPDRDAMFSDGPVPYPDVGSSKNIFLDTYSHFNTVEIGHQYILVLPTNDIKFNIDITKAFLHVIGLCDSNRIS